MTSQPSSSPVSATPRLTVVMTAWNAADSIERAIGSVLAETDVPLEVVVVDDASTDDTAAVVARIAAADPRVVPVVAPQNEGVSMARNRALDVARGTWLTFLDADDRLLPGAIDLLFARTVDPSVRIVIGQRIWTNGEREWRSKFYDIPDITEAGRKSIATHPGLLYYGSATGKIFHRSLLDGLRFEGRVLGDHAWAIRAMLRAGDAIDVIADTIYEWSRPHPSQQNKTISSWTRSSADKATRMAEVAPISFGLIAAEIDRCFADDPATSDRLKTAYLDRLIRADIAIPYKQALDRRDPATATFYRGVAAFLDTIPVRVLHDSADVVPRLIRPPLARWGDLVRPARAVYLEMAGMVLGARGGSSRGFGGRLAAPAFVLVRTLGRPIGTTLGSWWLSGLALASRLRRRLRG